MQKQSLTFLVGDYSPVELSKEFPISIPNAVPSKKSSTPVKNIKVYAHIHDCFEIGYCVSGNGTFLVANKILNYSTGDVIIINNQEFHLLEPESRNRSVWLFSNLDPASLLAGFIQPSENCFDTSMLCGGNFNNIISSAGHPDITGLVKNIFDELVNARAGYQSAVRGLVWSLMVKLQRLKSEPGEVSMQKSKDIKFLLPAMEFISYNFSEPLEVHYLAGLCNCSISTFRRVFKKNFACSPLHYINLLRLRIAGSLLKNTKMSVLDISLRCGFPTLSNFNRQFKSFYSISPRDWRRQKTGSHQPPE